jgi:uncharacterized membrane protein YfcA
MTVAHIALLLATGAFAGFASGLLGLGGSFIMTPVQYMVYTNMGLPADAAIKLAFGTSSLVVLPTALSGAWRHNRMGAVRVRAALLMGGCAAIAAFGGATLATYLPGAALRIAFGAVVLGSGIRMLTFKQVTVEAEPAEKLYLWLAWATLVGVIAGILGIGGGIVMVPVLVLALKFKVHNAVATSLGVMVFTSIGGALGYIINGLDVPNLPSYAVGYVHLPSWILLAVSSAGVAQLGALTAHRLPARQLSYIFVAVMFYLGLRMLGVFDWLGWPI